MSSGGPHTWEVRTNSLQYFVGYRGPLEFRISFQKGPIPEVAVRLSSDEAAALSEALRSGEGEGACLLLLTNSGEP
jgi:hypothetical protein